MRLKPLTCVVPGCSKGRHAHGYCAVHYKRVREHGDPNFMTPSQGRKPAVELTDEQVAEIVAGVRRFESKTAVGKRFGVTPQYVNNLMNRQRSAP